MPALAHGAEVWSRDGVLYGMVRLFARALFVTRMGPWHRAPISLAYLFDPLRPKPPIVRHDAIDGPAPVTFTGGDGAPMLARYVPWVEAAIERAKSVRGAEPIPPTLERLTPLIRHYLEKISRDR